MIRYYKLFNGDIVEFTNEKEHMELMEYDYNLRMQYRREQEEFYEGLKRSIEEYINTVLQLERKYRGCEIGLVYTKFEEDIQQYNAFMIYIDRGYMTSHEYIHLNDITL